MVWEKWIEGPHKAYATFPFIAAQGGLPIIIDGHVVGGIGVGSGTGEQDRIVAAAALASLPGAQRFD